MALIGTRPFTPSDIATFAWYDASDESTISDTAGAVSQLDDKSSSGYHMVPKEPGNEPSTGTRTLNGLNVLDFDGVTDMLYVTPQPSNQPPSAILIGVFDVDTDQANRDGLFNNQDRAGLHADNFYGGPGKINGVSDDNITYGSYLFGPNITCGVVNWDASASLPLSYCRAYNNGTQDGSDIACIREWTDGGNLSLMTENNLAQTTKGAVAEVIWVSNDTSEATRQKLEGYLAWKWGLVANLPISHPYKLARPTA